MNKKEKEQQQKNVDFLHNDRIQIYSHGFKLKFNDTNQSKTYTNWSSKDFYFMMNTQLIKSNQLDRILPKKKKNSQIEKGSYLIGGIGS